MSEILLVLETSPSVWVAVCAVMGLLIGSFLNVVILRLPVVLERDWKAQAREILGLPSDTPAEAFNLVKPRSRCPQCNTPIRAWQNVPLISYLLLRGRCAGCGKSIPIRYPAIELLSGLLAAYIAWRYGLAWATLGALLYTWSLIALTFIDLDHQLLPDDITLPLLWLGLLFSLGEVFVTPTQAIVGAMAGYGSLWLVFQAFRLLTGKEGMGFGDFKLFAALGAWLGWQQLPLVILLASVVGALLGGLAILLRGRDRAQPIPFGPFLALAGLIAFFWGDLISAWYLGLYRHA